MAANDCKSALPSPSPAAIEFRPDMTSFQFNPRDFRNALGHFATGVAIVTANAHGQFLGTTISSFNSVSLTPPLILFSIARSALSFDLWRRVERYGVTVLAEHQGELSNRFARTGVEKFEDLRLASMDNGSPLLPDWLAFFECDAYARHDGGDHEIFVGKVLAFQCRPQAEGARPLVFYGGKYRTLASDIALAAPPQPDAWLHGW
jgi:3-hydroxy-9,10-secoandrosta-1,3,5(10)-triene-9,17-dione monooxygenase reductase component